MFTCAIYVRLNVAAGNWRAVTWLRQNTWRITRALDVLVHNATGIAFWRAVGFSDYALTLEMDL